MDYFNHYLISIFLLVIFSFLKNLANDNKNTIKHLLFLMWHLVYQIFSFPEPNILDK